MKVPERFVHCAAPLLATLGCALGALAQSPISATLVSNDIAFARRDNQNNGEYEFQIQPPGPFLGTSLAVQGIQYACNLAPTAMGWLFTASSGDSMQAPNDHKDDHADLTLTLSAPPATIAAVEVAVLHGGDSSSASGMRVDLHADGTVDVDSGCSCVFLRAFRTWTWDFAQGDLRLRIRTDQTSYAGTQGYSVRIEVTPWVANALPVADGSPQIAYWRPSSDQESSNYQISALPPTTSGPLAILRGVGLGQFGAFLIADNPATSPVTLPNPFITTSNLLAIPQFLDFGTVTATTQWGGVTPREWQLTVPSLPPGMSFYAQHVSVSPPVASTYYPPAFGSTNILRFDT